MSILAKELGYTKQETHAICGMKFLKREKVIEKTGEIVPYIISSTALSKSEFADMVTDMVRWAQQDLSITIPLPNEQIEAELE